MADDVRPSEPDATLKPPQFTLRALLFATLVVGLVTSVMTAIGTFWAVALLFLLLLVSGHVIGNALGTRLRDRAATRPVAVPRSMGTHPARRVHVPQVEPRLSQHRRLHWFALVLTGAGALFGGYFGGAALARSYPDATAAAVWLGHVSAGVLSGLVVFALAAFSTVLRQAIREAHAASDRDAPAPDSTPAVAKKE